MIAIPQSLSKTVSENYFDLIKVRISERIRLMQLTLDVLEGNETMDKLENGNSHWNSIVSAANFFLHHNKLERLSDLPNLIPANAHPWAQTYSKTFRALLNHFADERRLKAIILISPENAVTADTTLKQQFGLTTNYPPGPGPLVGFVHKIIDYEGMHKHVAYTIAKQLQVDCCPYCNRVPTQTIFDAEDNELIRPAFDHFFSHKRYPFLGLSFFNLVPSCYYCNSSLKSDKEMKWHTHLNPFVEGYSRDCVFKATFKNFLPDISNPENFEIRLDPTIPSTNSKYRKIFGNNDEEGNNNLFKLQHVYAMHRDVVGELWLKAQRYSKGHKKALFAAFDLAPGQEERFYRFYFGNFRNEEDFNRRPLSKLSHDVVRQLLPELFT